MVLEHVLWKVVVYLIIWPFHRKIVSLHRSNYKVKQKYKTATVWGMGQPPQGFDFISLNRTKCGI